MGDEMGKHGQFAIIPARALDDVRFDGKARHMYALLILGTYADRDGWCWPSLKTIAERLGVTAPTVSNTMSDLAEWGYLLIIRSVGKPGESNEANHYRIIHDADLPTVYDKTQKKTPIKSHAGESNTLLNPTKEDLIPYKISPSEILQNVPLNVPIERGDSKIESPSPEEKEAEELYNGMPSQSAGMVRQEHTAATADPRIEKRQFVRQIAPICAEIMGRGVPISEDTRTAKKIFDKRLPLARVLERLDAYRNGEGEEFRKPNAIADWIVGRLERDIVPRVLVENNDAAIKARLMAA